MEQAAVSSRETIARLPTGTPIVVFGDDWGRHVSTMQHIFAHIGHEYPVIWVNAIGHRYPTLRWVDLRRVLEKISMRRTPVVSAQANDSGVAVRHPDALVRPRVLPWHGVRLIRGLNHLSLRRAVREALGQLRSGLPPFLVTGTPPSAHLIGDLGEWGSIYFCMDDFLHLPNVTASMIRPLEHELLRRVDALVATAQFLVGAKRPESGLTYYLPQGVNFDHFAKPRDVPEPLRSLPRPIIGFAGGIGSAFDQELVAKLAARFSAGSIVLVGPTSVPVGRLGAPNIHRLGPVPYSSLPAYVQAFDVGTIPYVENEHTRSVDPLKLLEYLAAGIEVVATALPEVMKYSDVVSVATGHDEFLAHTARALTAPREPAELRAFAGQHTWACRADKFLAIMADVREHASPR